MAVVADIIKRYNKGQELFRRRSVALLIAEIEQQQTELARLREANRLMRQALEALLYEIDYTHGYCGLTDMVSGVLDKRIIALAYAALASEPA